MKTAIVLAVGVEEKPGANAAAENARLLTHAQELANHISKNVSGSVTVGLQQPFTPSLSQAFERAIEDGAARVLVIPPTLVRGQAWTEEQIPALIRSARADHPSVEFAYVWPPSPTRVAKFLSSQLRSYL